MASTRVNGDAETAVFASKDFAQAGLRQQRSSWRCKALIHRSRLDLLPRFLAPAATRVKADIDRASADRSAVRRQPGRHHRRNYSMQDEAVVMLDQDGSPTGKARIHVKWRTDCRAGEGAPDFSRGLNYQPLALA
jgi:hypothetical protein